MKRTLSILSASSRLKPNFHLPYNLCLIGPPGSGKGTYGRLLSVAWNQTPIYSVSDILRQQPHRNDDASSGNDVNVQSKHNNSIITSNLNTGTLVDCEIVSQIVLSHLQNSMTNTSLDDIYDGETIESTKQKQHHRRQHQHFIMDGYPRTIRQIELMNKQTPHFLIEMRFFCR